MLKRLSYFLVIVSASFSFALFRSIDSTSPQNLMDPPATGSAGKGLAARVGHNLSDLAGWGYLGSRDSPMETANRSPQIESLHECYRYL